MAGLRIRARIVLTHLHRQSILHKTYFGEVGTLTAKAAMNPVSSASEIDGPAAVTRARGVVSDVLPMNVVLARLGITDVYGDSRHRDVPAHPA